MRVRSRLRDLVLLVLTLNFFKVVVTPSWGQTDTATQISAVHDGDGRASVPLNMDQFAPVILDVVINGNDRGLSGIMLRSGARLLFKGDDLDLWRIKRPAAPVLTQDGGDYYELAGLPDVSVVIDESRQIVRLQLPPSRQVALMLRGAGPPVELPSKGLFAAFLNYDVTAEETPFGKAAAGYFDSAISNEWGVVANSFIASTSTAANAAGSASRLARLDSSYVHDDPESFTRLLVGDGLTRNASWSAPVRFAGVQYGTDFALRPGFITFPTPGYNGRAVVPSAVELYVNDALRYQSNVDAGPFSLNQLPTLTGAGEMRFVVKDPAGIEQTVTMPYYVSSNLLQSGLTDYSVESGFERRNYGVGDADYDRAIMSGNLRHGLSDSLTTELHAEGNGRAQVGGVSFTGVWPAAGEFSIGAGDSLGNGVLGRVGFAHLGRSWSFSTNYQRASPGFRQIDWLEGALTVRSQFQVVGGWSFGDYGSFNLGYTNLDYSDGTKVGLITTNYDISLPENIYLNFYSLVLKSTGHSNSATFGTTVTIPFGERRSSSAGIEQRNGSLNVTSEFRQDPPTDQGVGYRLAVSRGYIDRREGDLTWRTNSGILTAQAVDDDTGVSGRLSASGSLAYADDLVFASRRIDDGFAVVTVPDSPHVTIYRENQPWTTTDEDGRAVVTDLRPYDVNRLSFDNGDLPIGDVISTDTLMVVPRYRGAVAAEFDVSRKRAATMIVQLPNGEPLPPALQITGDHRSSLLLSGYNGAVFIVSPVAGEQFDVRWDNNHCHFTLDQLPENATLPELGPYVCQPSSEP